MLIVHQSNRIPRHYSTSLYGGVDLCMEKTNLKDFLLPSDNPNYRANDKRAREVDDRIRASMPWQRCFEFGEAIERRKHRLSDQENIH